MPQTKRAGWGLIAAGLVFAIGALIPVFRGLELKGPLLIVAVLFLIVGVKKSRATESVPPAA